MKSQDKKIIQKKETRLASRQVAKLPDSPGVYIFRGRPERSGGLGKAIYIGKATSLRDRVRSYFNPDIVTTRSPLISKMLSQFDRIDHVKTDSVLEALVLEANLIKKYQPEANIKEKDNRSFNFVVITKENFPKVLVVRGRELEISKQYDVSYSFGPFPSGGQLREAMKLIRKMFPYRDDKCKALSGKRPSESVGSTEASRPNVPCFNRQIGLCPGTCTGEISKEEYAKRIQNIILFFEGHKKRLIKNLEKQMKEYAKKKEFEKADEVKRTLFALTHIQDISLIKENVSTSQSFRIESYDIAHLSGTHMVGVMTVVENGEKKLSDYRKFKIKENIGVDDTKALEEVLSRRLAHIEWLLPDLIVVDGGTAQKRRIEKVLREHHSKIPVVSVVKDEHHRPREILGDLSRLTKAGKKRPDLEKEIILSNAEAHRFAISFHKNLRSKIF